MIMKKQKPPSPLFIINNGELKEVSRAPLSTYLSDLALSPFSLSCPPPLLVNNNDEALFEN
jgi:hypothetical protein